MTKTTRSHFRRLIPVCLCLLAIDLFVINQLRGPAPLPATAPIQDFSEGRARQILKRLLGDESPHPSLSAENDRVREQIVRELTDIGLEVKTEDLESLTDQARNIVAEERQCDPKDVVARNVFGTIRNSAATGRPVMLVSHYDSSSVAPGAGDSCGNVAAIIECARALSESGPLNCPVHVLLTDAEEQGLIGAHDFAARHGAMNPIVLNCDAQGSSGPSLMIETQLNNLSLMQSVAQMHARPFFSGSIFVSIYRLISGENGRTDFSEFLRADWEGLNFVYIGSRENYHTPNDTIENLSARTLQHVGQNLLSISRGLAQGGQPPSKPGRAIFFDVFGLWLIVVPTTVALPLAAAISVVSVLRCFRTVRDGGLSIFRIAARLVLTVSFCLVLSGVLGRSIPRLAVFIDRFPGLPPNQPFAAAMAIAALLAGFCGALFFKSLSIDLRQDFINALWALAALGLALFDPAMSYLFLVPGTVFVLLRNVSEFPRNMICAVVAATVLLPILHLLPHALGANGAIIICPVFTLFSTCVWPWLLPDTRTNSAVYEQQIV